MEIEHTADWSIRVRGNNLENLFLNALMGFYMLSGVESNEMPIEERELLLNANDLESLLVLFLEEALFLIEVENAAFEVNNLVIEDKTLKANIMLSEILAIEKEIKAVTFSGLKIKKASNGYNVNIVFDV